MGWTRRGGDAWVNAGFGVTLSGRPLNCQISIAPLRPDLAAKTIRRDTARRTTITKTLLKQNTRQTMKFLYGFRTSRCLQAPCSHPEILDSRYPPPRRHRAGPSPPQPRAPPSSLSSLACVDACYPANAQPIQPPHLK